MKRAFLLKKRKKVLIKRQLKKSGPKQWKAWPQRKKSPESVAGGTKKRQSGRDAVKFLKEKAEIELSIHQQELKLQMKKQEARVKQ